jgi:hypothetical protein
MSEDGADYGQVVHSTGNMIQDGAGNSDATQSSNIKNSAEDIVEYVEYVDGKDNTCLKMAL